MNKEEIQAARERCESATVLVDDEVLRLVARYSPAAAETIQALVADLPAALEALEDARMLCMNDHAYDNETSQVFEAVQVINRALADTPSAAAALLAQGEGGKRLLQKYGSHLAWCRARNNLIPGAGKTECDCGFYAAALAPGEET